MITEAGIRDEIKPIEGLDWITALRAPAIRPLVEAGKIQLSFFDERDLAEIQSPDYPGERLIVCKNSLMATRRARPSWKPPSARSIRSWRPRRGPGAP